VHLKNDTQIMMLRELAKGPVENTPKGLYGADMEYLVTAGYVDKTAEADNRATYKITDEGRAALKRSVGEG
jgi:DNA-binding PadR family transcriptional regulator